jgi:hypothetical protein
MTPADSRRRLRRLFITQVVSIIVCATLAAVLIYAAVDAIDRRAAQAGDDASRATLTAVSDAKHGSLIDILTRRAATGWRCASARKAARSLLVAAVKAGGTNGTIRNLRRKVRRTGAAVSGSTSDRWTCCRPRKRTRWTFG